jgi:hypothetical protein
MDPLPPLPPLTVPRASYVGALLALLVPGLGHWWIGRARRGLLLFIVGTLGVNAVFASLVLDRGDRTPFGLYLGLPVALLAWLVSALDGLRLATFSRNGKTREIRVAELADGVRKLAAEDWRGARTAFARAASPDGADAASLLGLARAERMLNEPARALDHARRALQAGAPEMYRAALKVEASAARAALRSSRTAGAARDAQRRDAPA